MPKTAFFPHDLTIFWLAVKTMQRQFVPSSTTFPLQFSQTRRYSFTILGSTSIVIHNVNQRLLRKQPGSGSYDLPRLLARKITELGHSLVQTSLAEPQCDDKEQVELWRAPRYKLYSFPVSFIPDRQVYCTGGQCTWVGSSIRHRHRTIENLEERGVERGSVRRSSLKGRETREGHRQSDEHWNRSEGNVGGTSGRRSGAHMGFSERIDTTLNWTQLSIEIIVIRCIWI